MPDNSKVCGDSGRAICGGCGRSFFPDGSRKKFCDHDCYARSLRVPIEQRFWSRVNKNSPPPAHLPQLGPCWLFTGKARLREYGSVAGVLNGKRRPLYAHRVAWELTYESVPDGLCVLHRCDTPLCCNPSHLFLGTQADNLEDARQKGRLIDGAHLIKVDDAGVLDIRTNYRPGHNGKVLAAKYGISLTHLLRIVREGHTSVFERVPSRQLEIRGEVA